MIQDRGVGAFEVVLEPEERIGVVEERVERLEGRGKVAEKAKSQFTLGDIANISSSALVGYILWHIVTVAQPAAETRFEKALEMQRAEFSQSLTNQQANFERALAIEREERKRDNEMNRAEWGKFAEVLTRMSDNLAEMRTRK